MAGADHTSPQKAIASTLREVREHAGLQQIELAERIGKTQSYISKIEGGHQGVDILLLFEIATAIGIEPVDLFARIVRQLPRATP